MSRRPRIVMPNVPLHIIQRGNDRVACFYSEHDYLFYLENLTDLANKYGCKIHAFCLMTNHVHLLLSPDCIAGAGLLMKGFGQRTFNMLIAPIIGQALSGKGAFDLV